GTPKRSSTTPTAVTTAPTCADASPPCCWAWPPARFAPSIRTGPTPPRRGSSWRGAGWPRLNDADALDEKSLIFGSPIPHLRARWWTSRGGRRTSEGETHDATRNVEGRHGRGGADRPRRAGRRRRARRHRGRPGGGRPRGGGSRGRLGHRVRRRQPGFVLRRDGRHLVGRFLG